MKFIYEYIYYKIYSFLSLFGKNDIIEWSSMIMFSVIIGTNVFTILDIIKINNPNSSIVFTRFLGQFIAVVLMIVNYFVFIKKKQYKRIMKEYPQKDSDLGTVLVILYVLISVWCVFHYGKQIRILDGVDTP